jgi:hypothetical protein
VRGSSQFCPCGPCMRGNLTDGCAAVTVAVAANERRELLLLLPESGNNHYGLLMLYDFRELPMK